MENKSVAMRRVLSFATITAIGFALGRVSGVVREMVVSAQFGLSAELDAYFIAFLVPTLINNIVAGSAIHAAAMPTLARYLAANDRAEFWRVASSVTNFLLLVTSALTILAILLGNAIIAVIGAGLTPATQMLAAQMLVIMMPTLILGALLNMLMAILNALDRFTAPALIFIALNLGIIATVFLLTPLIGVYAVAWGFLIGVALQVVIQLIELRGERPQYKFILDWRHPALKEIGGAFIPITALAIIAQINLVIDRAMAATLPPGSVSALAYADTILGSFYALGISLGIAVFPSLSRMVAQNDLENMARTIFVSLRLLIFILAPLTFLLIPFAPHAIGLLLGRGRFDAAAVELTSAALAMYAIGLTGIAALYIVQRAFYALGASRVPLIVGTAAALAHIGLNFALMRGMAHAGIALSTALTATVSAIFLLIVLARKMRALDVRALLIFFARASLLALVCAFATSRAFALLNLGDTSVTAWVFGIIFAIGGGGLYFVIALFARVPESAMLAHAVSGFFKRK